MKENIQIVDGTAQSPTTGTMGLRTQIPGGMCSVSALASASGGIGRAHLVETDN